MLWKLITSFLVFDELIFLFVKLEYKKLNPMGQVPALAIDGHTLADSVSLVMSMFDNCYKYTQPGIVGGEL